MLDTLSPTPGTYIVVMLGFALFFSGLIIDFIFLTRHKELKATWEARVTYLRARPWTWQDAAIIIFAVCLTFSIATLLLPFISSNQTNDLVNDSVVIVLIKTLLFHGPALIAILALMRIRGFGWKQAFGATKNRFKHDIMIGISFYIGAIPIVIGLGILSAIVLTIFNIPLDQQEIASMFTSAATPLWLKLYLIILAVIVAPIVEEACFRGILLPLFIKNNKPIHAILLVSLLFAIVHFHIPSIAPLAGIAAAFSLAYIYTGSLVTPIVMHAIFNTISILALITMQYI